MPSKKQKPINLALQGGGAHGAFTWGVLDYLLEDGRLDFEGVSATSAGAMNAAALAYGKSSGGSEKAREVLEHFWHEVSREGSVFSPFAQSWSLAKNTFFSFFDHFTHNVSPYQFNPMNYNPLENVIKRVIDFEAIHHCECMNLFITATEVHSGSAKIFKNEDIDTKVLLATAALPFLYQAVEIENQHYWDGGYIGNPSLWPLFYEAECRDILMVHVNPLKREELPKEAYAIEDRMNEITFNASLLKELRAIDFVKKLINEDMLKDEYKDQYKDILLHAVRADDVMRDLSVSSKFDTDWKFLQSLRDQGRAEAKKWLEQHYNDIGQCSSVDIQKDYLAA